jgi:hypothetical protein
LTIAKLDKKCCGIRIKHHLDADPDPAFHFDADPETDPIFHFDVDPDPAPHGYKICNYWFTEYRPSTAKGEPLRLKCKPSRFQVEPPWIYCKPPHIPAFHCNADRDPACPFDADPDPAYPKRFRSGLVKLLLILFFCGGSVHVFCLTFLDTRWASMEM